MAIKSTFSRLRFSPSSSGFTAKMLLPEEEGFEPSVAYYTTPVFKTGALNRSATLPKFFCEIVGFNRGPPAQDLWSARLFDCTLLAVLRSPTALRLKYLNFFRRPVSDTRTKSTKD